MQPKKNISDQSAAAKPAAAARAISILYNNSRVYGIEHAVFRRTLEEQTPAIHDALDEMEELAFSFLKGKVRCGAILLEPSSTMFQGLADAFEKMGIAGFLISKGVTIEEISKLIGILVSREDEIVKHGLQSLLDRAKTPNIKETKPTLDLDGKLKPAETAEEKKPARTAGQSKVFVLDDSLEPGSPSEPPADSGVPKLFKEFVSDTLSELARKKTDVSQAAERISSEFDQRLNAITDTLRREKETISRRLESVKNVLFAKLEAMKVMAILVDTTLKVLKMTSKARDLIGDVDSLPASSQLADCVRRQCPEMEITIAGQSVTAQLIASDRARMGETILLLTLNSERE